jgi:hypothetical protein
MMLTEVPFVDSGQGRTRRGEGACQAAALPQKPKFKKQDFVDIMVSKVLRDLPFRQNWPLESADN